MEGYVISQLTRFLTTGSDHRRKGDFFERKAHRFLAMKGLKKISSNYQCRYGEIDLICRDGKFLVFIEVRYREKNNFGSALDSVTPEKQRKIRLTAKHFLQKNGLGNRMPCRFDVVGIDKNDGKLNYQWIKNAF